MIEWTCRKYHLSFTSTCIVICTQICCWIASFFCWHLICLDAIKNHWHSPIQTLHVILVDANKLPSTYCSVSLFVMLEPFKKLHEAPLISQPFLSNTLTDFLWSNFIKSPVRELNREISNHGRTSRRQPALQDVWLVQHFKHYTRHRWRKTCNLETESDSY